ncbi:MAG: hypothetical protein JNK20_17290 [Flavipsychrobacter sp.]|nr:hypothetical protein [Flavipsychrobacter sp.]
MKLPLQKGLRAFFGMFLLLMLPLAGTMVKQTAGKNSLDAVSQTVVLEEHETLDTDLNFSALQFEFGNWVPEAIRSVTIRMTQLAFPDNGLDIFIKFIPALVIFPLHQPEDFSIKPDFVGYLFRLKPF